MTLQLAPQLLRPYISLGEFTGKIIITVPIKCTGNACDATVNLYIYEAGPWWSWVGGILRSFLHGPLLAQYSQDVHFESGEMKAVQFTHTEAPTTGETSRDVGLEVVVNGEVVASHEWDDVYTVVPAAGTDWMSMITGMMPMIMMLMMMGMVMPMVTGMGEE